jgi:hypothetical protein
MKKQLTFLLAITFLGFFSGSAVSGEKLEIKKEYWDNGKLKMETGWYESGKKKGS